MPADLEPITITNQELLAALAVMQSLPGAHQRLDSKREVTRQDCQAMDLSRQARSLGGPLRDQMDPKDGTWHEDAAESLFFLRELEFIKAKTYDHKYAQFRARELIPVDTSAGPGAETIVYRSYDSRGVAKWINSYADDLADADAFGKEVRSAVRGFAVAYRYNVHEIDAAYMAGKPLQERKALAARRACEQFLDNVAALGDADNAMIGLTNVTNCNSYTVPSGSTLGADQTWATKTGLEILADLVGITSYGVTTTKEVEIPDTILLPTSEYELIAGTPVTSLAQETILSFFLRTSPHIKVVHSWPRLTKADADGTDMMICYRREPDALQLAIPQEFTQLPPQPDNLSYKIPCVMRTGGVIVYYPMSLTIGTGIGAA